MRALTPIVLLLGGAACSQNDKLVSQNVKSSSHPLQSALGAATDALRGIDVPFTGRLEAPDVVLQQNALSEPDKGCATVLAEPSFARNAVPQNFRVTWIYAACPPQEGAKFSGKRSVEVERNAAVTRVTGWHFASYERPDDPVEISHSDTQVDSRGTPPEMVRSELQTRGGRHFVKSGETTRYHQQHTQSFDVADTYEPDRAAPGAYNLARRSIDGEATIEHQSGAAQTRAIFRGVTYEVGLCPWPVAGEVSLTTRYGDDAPAATQTYTWERPCGTAVLDGEAVHLGPES